MRECLVRLNTGAQIVETLQTGEWLSRACVWLAEVWYYILAGFYIQQVSTSGKKAAVSASGSCLVSKQSTRVFCSVVAGRLANRLLDVGVGWAVVVKDKRYVQTSYKVKVGKGALNGRASGEPSSSWAGFASDLGSPCLGASAVLGAVAPQVSLATSLRVGGALSVDDNMDLMRVPVPDSACMYL